METFHQQSVFHPGLHPQFRRMTRALPLQLGANLLLAALSAASGRAQIVWGAPVDMDVPFPPAEVVGNGRVQLAYELHITNFGSEELTVTRVEVLGDENAAPLLRYEGDALGNNLARPGLPPDTPDKVRIGPGLRAIVFLWLSLDAGVDVPRQLRHRLFLASAAEPAEESSVEGPPVEVRTGRPLVISAPLRGGGWLVANGPGMPSVHRRALMIAEGKARIPHRFAIDWIKIGDDGKVFVGDPGDNANWAAYGTEVLAVANGVVAAIKDGIVENNPASSTRAGPIDADTVNGNYVVLDLGRGRFAFYGHLQPNSLRVNVGDRVRRGQLLALVGNSGDSDAPHLHFHIADAASPLAAEGLPYALDSFEVQGVLLSLDPLVKGEGWRPEPNRRIDIRDTEIPMGSFVVRFPNP
jgi:murein DD-endopeptidase MepM/ murein hydrolase activator NlpD